MAHIVIETQNSFDKSDTVTRTTIDLSDSIKSESNVDLQLSTITPLSSYNECNVVGVDGLSYAVETNNPQVCRFEYTVVPTSGDIKGKGWGLSEIAVTDGRIEKLPPYGRAIIQGTTTNVSLLLPEGTLLDPDSLELRGTTYSEFKEDNLGSVTAEGNKIQYTAPITTYGQVQIYYTAFNDITGILYSGIVYVAISLDANSAPTAQLNKELDSISMVATPTLTIDVEEYVNDIDEDTLQVVNVYTHGTGWAKINPMSTSFTFTPTELGTHHIAYVVSDRRGGYAIGTIFFEARQYDSIYDASQKKTFFPTFDSKVISSIDGIYTDTFLESGSFGFPGFYPTFNLNLAESYCNIRGLTLPSAAEMESLYENPLSGSSAWESDYKWPTGVPYIVTDGYFSLNDGTRESIDAYDSGFVSCVYEYVEPEDYFFESRYLSATWNKTATVTALKKFGEDDLSQLPSDHYALETTVVSTVPAGLTDSVVVETNKNRLIVSNDAHNVRSAIINVTDKSVKGDPSTVTIYVGVTKCPADVSVVETQVLGCIPVIHDRDDDIAFSGAMSTRILESIGFDLSIEIPPYIKLSGTAPNYMYADADIFDETTESFESNAVNMKFFGQLCEIMNVNAIDGRSNWVPYLEDYRLLDLKSSGAGKAPKTFWVEELARQLTEWMNGTTGLGTYKVGQGYLVNVDGELMQVNQYNADLKGQIQARWEPGISADEREWQHITCVSPSKDSE